VGGEKGGRLQVQFKGDVGNRDEDSVLFQLEFDRHFLDKTA
jgi:hypothetical protein